MGKTILYIEDDKVIAKMIGSHLSKQGHNVYIAGDGDSGIKMAEQHSPNLIFLDVILPGRDGYHICSEIKKSSKIQHCPIVMLTSEDKMESVWTGMESGATDYIFKAQPVAKLLARIDKMILDYAL